MRRRVNPALGIAQVILFALLMVAMANRPGRGDASVMVDDRHETWSDY